MVRIRNRKAFTLVEMLVVVAIVLLFIALLLPALTLVEEYAKYVECMNNMRNLYSGLASYATDRSGRMPYYWDEGDLVNNLDGTPMWWGYPAVRYLVENFPEENPYKGAPWNNPYHWADFAKYLRQNHRGISNLFYCQAGDNGYFTGKYEGRRVYTSNYYGYFGPDNDISWAIGRNREYQSSSRTGFNRPITLGLDVNGTWLLSDFSWGKNVTAHKDKFKNILHLDGSVFLTAPQYWANHYVWLDRFPGE
jgi:prepilin-type N-terminal cleavage/methylation domain-containing protein